MAATHNPIPATAPDEVSDQSLSPASPRLNYAPAPAWHRRRRFRRVLLCFFILAGAGCFWRWHVPPQAVVTDISEIAKNYRGLEAMTQEAVYVNPELAMLCRGASWEDVEAAKIKAGPHANTRIRIYMNDLAAKAFRASSPQYPVGSVIVKQKEGEGYLDKERKMTKTLDGVGGMVKRAAGYDAAHGDWEYFYFQDVSNVESGKIVSCVQCHAGAAKDHVFGTWSKG